MLTDEQVKEFQEICKSETGVELSKEEAYRQGLALVELIELLYHPVGKKDIDTTFNGEV